MEMLRRNGPHREYRGVSPEAGRDSVVWWERFAKDVGLEPGVKEIGRYGW